MKDNFSQQSSQYAQFRPRYPGEIFQLIREHLFGIERAWDCGTGNGQIATELSKFFGSVEATDISEKQLENAYLKENIHYSLQRAEKTDFPSANFDLIISAQAVHWFDRPEFYKEVRRCLKSDGILVLMGYGLFYSTEATNKIIQHFYKDIIGPFWDPERKHLEESYQSIDFPFAEIESPEFIQKYNWSVEHLLGYLRTWSAVKNYEKKHKNDPVSLIEVGLREAFGKENTVNFPIFMRMGKLS